MKKFVKMLCLGLVVLAASFVLVACGDASAKQLTYVSMRINPEIELVADSSGTVVAVNAKNEDGEVVLSNVDLVGKSTEEAGKEFASEATELGYLDADTTDGTVYVEVEGENAENVKLNLAERLNKYFDNNGIYGKVSSETLSEYADKASEWGVSVGQVKMIMRILDLYPEMTAEDVLALSVNERIALIKDHSKKNGVIAELKTEYKQKVEELKTKYSDMFTLKSEIETLEDSLENTELTESEKATIQSQIDEKETALKPMLESFKTELDALKSEYKAKSEELIAQLKAENKTKEQENKEKISSHKSNFEKDSDVIKEKIQNWRRTQNCIQG